MTTIRRRFQRGQLIDDRDRWMCRYRKYMEANGQVTSVRVYEFLCWKREAPTRRHAQKLLEDLLRQEGVNESVFRPVKSGRFKEFAEKWMAEIMVHDKASTQRARRSYITRHLIPAFGFINLSEIHAETIQRWVSQNREFTSIRFLVTLLKVMWKTAKAWGYTQADPFEGLKLPARTKRVTYNFTAEESIAIIDAAVGPYKLLFRVAAECGMRPGEIAGLRVSDVSPRSLRVAQSVWNQKIQTPKTENSIRQFAISRELGESLAEYIRIERRTDLVFLNSKGKPLHMGYVNTEVLGPILEKLGIRAKLDALGVKKCGNYAFRHMNMTELGRQGVPLKTIQKRVGHAEGSDVTMNHYIHSVDADDLRAADLMGALLNPKHGPVQ